MNGYLNKIFTSIYKRTWSSEALSKFPDKFGFHDSPYLQKIEKNKIRGI